MKKLLFSLLIIFSFFVFVSAQTNEAEKIDEFGDENCEVILARSDNLFAKLKDNPTSLAYVIFYEGKHLQLVYDRKTKKSEREYLNPRYGEARNKAKAISLYLTKWRKMSKNRLVLIDGGYRGNYGIELWIAPQNTKPPKPSPDLARKDIKFRKGKTPGVADCQGSF